MAQSLYTAAAGLQAQQRNIDTIANNIANVNTDGYRKSRVEFQEAVYSAMLDPSLPLDGQTADLQRGSGVLAAVQTTLLDPGPLLQTGEPLDLAIGGDGYYMVEGTDGETLYTRDGKFRSVAADGVSYLATTGGRFVLDGQGRRISAARPLDGADVDETGRITLDGTFVADLGIRRFPRPSALEAAGSLMWRATDASGAAAPATDGYTVTQGFVEGSNVDLGDEMTRLMSAQRAYAFLGRAITTSDNMSAVENDIRR